MNPHSQQDTAWPRLTAAARHSIAEDTRDVSAPYGFATRIAARALGPERASAAPLLAKLTLRVFGVACLLAIVSLTINLGTILRDIDEEADALGNAPIETADVDITPDIPNS